MRDFLFFLIEVGKLKRTPRKGWVLRGIISRIKNKIFTFIPYQLLGIKSITFWFAATADTLEIFLFPI